jgi:hypothetical protein
MHHAEARPQGVTHSAQTTEVPMQSIKIKVIDVAFTFQAPDNLNWRDSSTVLAAFLKAESVTRKGKSKFFGLTPQSATMTYPGKVMRKELADALAEMDCELPAELVEALADSVPA